jgi:hypothetical protein
MHLLARFGASQEIPASHLLGALWWLAYNQHLR